MAKPKKVFSEWPALDSGQCDNTTSPIGSIKQINNTWMHFLHMQLCTSQLLQATLRTHNKSTVMYSMSYSITIICSRVVSHYLVLITVFPTIKGRSSQKLAFNILYGKNE